jgi:DNA mismatch endonuclease, patch repair protein
LVDIVTQAKRSEMMAGIKGKNTKPEIIVRQVLHLLGFRFRLHRKNLPGKPDLVLPKWHAVIFVHGCFWHGHTNCPLFRLPKSRTEFWKEKISKNKVRDDVIRKQYQASEWRYFEIWECALKGASKLDQSEFAREFVSAIQNTDVINYEIRGHEVA